MKMLERFKNFLGLKIGIRGSLSRLESIAQTAIITSEYSDDFPTKRLPLIILGSLSSFVGIVFVWSLFARTDITISSNGRFRPSASPVTIRSKIPGISQAIHVVDGELVSRGQTVIEMDRSPLLAKQDEIKSNYASLYQRVRDISEQIRIPVPANLPAPDKPSYLFAKPSILSAKQLAKSHEEELGQISAQITQTKQRIYSLKEKLKTQRYINSKQSTLLRLGAISEIQYLEQRQRMLDIETEYTNYLQELKRYVLAYRQKSTDFTYSNSDQYSKYLSELKQALADLSSIKQQLGYTIVKSPLNGFIFKLNVKSVGVPISQGEELFQVIPTSALILVVDVPASQIGFIKKGLNVDIHIDSYPSSSYGILKGKVLSVGSDSTPPTTSIQEPTYSVPVIIKPITQYLSVNNLRYSIKPGMTARVVFPLRSVSVFQHLFDATSSFIRP